MVELMVVPVRFLSALREELIDKVSEAELDAIFERAGQAAAREMVTETGPPPADMDPIQALFDLTMEAGLGRPDIHRDGDGWRIANEEAPEANTGKCSYTIGFLAVTLGYILGDTILVVEERCGKGSGPCIYIATRAT